MTVRPARSAAAPFAMLAAMALLLVLWVATGAPLESRLAGAAGARADTTVTRL